MCAVGSSATTFQQLGRGQPRGKLVFFLVVFRLVDQMQDMKLHVCVHDGLEELAMLGRLTFTPVGDKVECLTPPFGSLDLDEQFVERHDRRPDDKRAILENFHSQRLRLLEFLLSSRSQRLSELTVTILQQEL